jgi:cytochrome c
MNSIAHVTLAKIGFALSAGLILGSVAFAADSPPPPVDAVAAKSLALKNSCLRCHGVTKKKEGPTYAEVAAKYKDKPDAEQKLYDHLTSGEIAKMSDGHKEYHKIIGTMDADQIHNLVRWILAQ